MRLILFFRVFISKVFILVGNKAVHGIKIISTLFTIIVNAMKIALIGDKISYPKYGYGINIIIEYSSEYISDRKAIVVDGCLVISSASDCAIG